MRTGATQKLMDPATAILNAYTATLTFLGILIDKAPAEMVGAIITKHEARLDRMWSWLGKVPGAVGALFRDDPKVN